ncbi:hypothetical protein EVAR_18655_1 [Eumeta japonica]|uniref:Uncharacterized protein n=1 Tax=Eumeta variegata TaxID=151549 RepID=A0A4C1U7W3_EUMVA|nr:hypothetical protein EVAR_18655_1 [Eumeta japonica]
MGTKVKALVNHLGSSGGDGAAGDSPAALAIFCDLFRRENEVYPVTSLRGDPTRERDNETLWLSKAEMEKLQFQ